MPHLTDHAVVSASVESILSERPKLFRTSDGIIGVAAKGVLMTYRDYIRLVCANLGGHPDASMDRFILNRSVEEHSNIKSLYRGVGVPSSYENDFRINPFQAVAKAMQHIFIDIRQRENKSHEIVRMLQEVEDDYTEACGNLG